MLNTEKYPGFPYTHRIQLSYQHNLFIWSGVLPHLAPASSVPITSCSTLLFTIFLLSRFLVFFSLKIGSLNKAQYIINRSLFISRQPYNRTKLIFCHFTTKYNTGYFSTNDLFCLTCHSSITRPSGRVGHARSRSIHSTQPYTFILQIHLLTAYSVKLFNH
jgi:hypothetical protein